MIEKKQVGKFGFKCHETLILNLKYKLFILFQEEYL